MNKQFFRFKFAKRKGKTIFLSFPKLLDI